MKRLSSIQELQQLLAGPDYDVTMPALFIGHGSPMNVLEDNTYRQSWEQLGKTLPVPRAILCISAHWYTKGTFVLTQNNPRTIHDFYGFPEALFKKQYPAPGAPELAQNVIDIAKPELIQSDTEWGLDHGCWAVLAPMFPDASIPVIQLSIDASKPPEYHYHLAQKLQTFRQQGVLIIGSGNIVHNLRMMRFDNSSYDWALEFDAYSFNHLLGGNDEALINYTLAGTSARYAVPTEEHYLPLLYFLGVRNSTDTITFFNEHIDLASVSMRSVIYA